MQFLLPAGDVNADGYADIVLGAVYYDHGEVDGGRAYVMTGSAGGINTEPMLVIESDQGNSLLGSSVGSAGVVNGDGYDDVVVGAYYYSGGQTREGRTFLYYGFDNSVVDTWVAEGDQDWAYFGQSVQFDGDVNDDGYVYLVIGLSIAYAGVMPRWIGLLLAFAAVAILPAELLQGMIPLYLVSVSLTMAALVWAGIFLLRIQSNRLVSTFPQQISEAP